MKKIESIVLVRHLKSIVFLLLLVILVKGEYSEKVVEAVYEEIPFVSGVPLKSINKENCKSETSDSSKTEGRSNFIMPAISIGRMSISGI
jgi:hypothetical protein